MPEFWEGFRVTLLLLGLVMAVAERMRAPAVPMVWVEDAVR